MANDPDWLKKALERKNLKDIVTHSNPKPGANHIDPHLKPDWYRQFEQARTNDHQAVTDLIRQVDPVVTNRSSSSWLDGLKAAASDPQPAPSAQTQPALARRQAIAWPLMLGIAAITGFILWLLSASGLFNIYLSAQGSSFQRSYGPPALFLWSPVIVSAMMVYLWFRGGYRWQAGLGVALFMFGAPTLGLLIYPVLSNLSYQEQYLSQLIFHVPLIAVIALGVFLLGRPASHMHSIYLLVKGIEIAVVGVLLAFPMFIMLAIVDSIDRMLNYLLPYQAYEFIFALAGGLVPLTAFVLIYDPQKRLEDQPFRHAGYRFVFLILRTLILFMPIALLLAFFQVLTAFSYGQSTLTTLTILMIFVVVTLFVASFEHEDLLEEGNTGWRRWMIQISALLGFLTCLTIAWRFLDRVSYTWVTPELFVLIGWNLVNSLVLLHLFAWPLLHKDGGWFNAVKLSFTRSVILYAAWALVVIVVIPFFFLI